MTRLNDFICKLKPSRLEAVSNRLYTKTKIDCFSDASFAHINNSLLEQLGIEKQLFTSDENLSLFTGNHSFTHLQPISTVYAGHQFGVYTSKLGDGRVHILGDISTTDGSLWELQLKGAGATPYARGNTGRMSLAEAITEYLGSEAMAGLGIPTTRGLALINQSLYFKTSQGFDSIFVRTAQSHLRFGHFEYLHNQADLSSLKTLADHVIEQFYPELLHIDTTQRYLQLLYAITQRTARLLAQWQSVGFIHSVMNTDNMSILGLTIDYGVYGFMETYDPEYSPNENDDQDRYAFNQQVDVARWNCLALAEALIELLPSQRIPAALLRLYRKSYKDAYYSLMRKKLGLCKSNPGDEILIKSLLELLDKHNKDYTDFFRQFSYTDSCGKSKITGNHQHWHEEYNQWFKNYQRRFAIETITLDERLSMMLANNPNYILRQDMLDHVIYQAEQYANFKPLNELLILLQSPFTENKSEQYLK